MDAFRHVSNFNGRTTREAVQLTLDNQVKQIERLRRIIHRYGDRVAMATSARPDWQQEIDDAMAWVASHPEVSK